MFRRLTAAAMALVAVASLSMPAHAADPPTSTVPFANGSTVYNEAVFNDGNHFWVEHLVGGWTGSAWKAWSVDPATGAGLVLNSQEHTDLQALLQALATPLLPMGGANSANQQLVVSGLGQLHTDLTGGGLLTASQLGAAGLATAAGQAQAHTDAQAIATAAASPALPATAPTLANQQLQVTAEQATAAKLAGTVQVSMSAPPTGAATSAVQSQQLTAEQAIQANTTSNATAANQLGTSSFTPGQATAGTSAAVLVAARAARRSLTIENTGTTPIYLGGSGVTPSTGFLLPGVAGASVSINFAGALYAVTASGSAAVTFYELY